STSPRSLLRRFARGLSWSFVGSVFNQGSTFAVNLVVANLLGREIFGKYAIVQSTAVAGLQLAQLATGYTATKYVAEYRVIDVARASRILGLCAIVSVSSSFVAGIALVVGANALATHVFHLSELTSTLRLAAVVLFCGVNTSLLTGALTGLEEYRAVGISGV